MTADPPTGGAARAPLTLVTDDGLPIAATRFRARGVRRGVALVAPATGAPQHYYRPFAEHLASAGWDVLTWDWRGVAESRFGLSPRDPRLTMGAWGRHDLAAAIAWADRRADGLPVVVVGHSFGGQAVGLAPNADRIDALALVASQHGWLGHWPLRSRVGLCLLWYLAVPLVSTLLGRWPSSWLARGEDLPGGVAREWAAWCRSRDYHGAWEGHRRLRARVHALTFDDDPIAPPGAAAALLAEYAWSVATVHRHVAPLDVGVDAIGHFGFFREGRVPGLWRELLDFLEATPASAA
jgi:predicted alpha/beta hydrolase